VLVLVCACNEIAVAVIYGTTNGWKTVTQQLTFPGGSLITVNFANSTYGWAGGALIASSFDRVAENNNNDDSTIAKMEGVAFLTTDGGKTWTQYNQLKNFYFMQISTVGTYRTIV